MMQSLVNLGPTEGWKSTIRHILTALGVLLAAFGLGEVAGFVDLLSENLDAWAGAIQVLIGAWVTIKGYWADRERFEDRAKVRGTKA